MHYDNLSRSHCLCCAEKLRRRQVVINRYLSRLFQTALSMCISTALSNHWIIIYHANQCSMALHCDVHSGTSVSLSGRLYPGPLQTVTQL